MTVVVDAFMAASCGDFDALLAVLDRGREVADRERNLRKQIRACAYRTAVRGDK